MLVRHAGRLAAILLGLAWWPATAAAQYRNHAIGFDFSYLAISKPSVLRGGDVLAAGNRGDRLSMGLRLGGEYNFKLHRDHWWFSTRFNFFDMMFTRPGLATLDQQAQTYAAELLGFNFGIEGLIGLRYVFLTDRFRPYLQLSMGYLRLFSFGASATQTCTLGDDLCGGANSYREALLPRVNFMPIHVAPSIEWIITRDVALHIILDYARWITFRGRGNNVFLFGLGANFFG